MQGCATGMLNQTIENNTVEYKKVSEIINVNNAYMSNKYELFICMETAD